MLVIIIARVYPLFKTTIMMLMMMLMMMMMMMKMMMMIYTMLLKFIFTILCYCVVSKRKLEIRRKIKDE